MLASKGEERKIIQSKIEHEKSTVVCFDFTQAQESVENTAGLEDISYSKQFLQ